MSGLEDRLSVQLLTLTGFDMRLWYSWSMRNVSCMAVAVRLTVTRFRVCTLRIPQLDWAPQGTEALIGNIRSNCYPSRYSHSDREDEWNLGWSQKRQNLRQAG